MTTIFPGKKALKRASEKLADGSRKPPPEQRSPLNSRYANGADRNAPNVPNSSRSWKVNSNETGLSLFQLIGE